MAHFAFHARITTFSTNYPRLWLTACTFNVFFHPHTRRSESVSAINDFLICIALAVRTSTNHRAGGAAIGDKEHRTSKGTWAVLSFIDLGFWMFVRLWHHGRKRIEHCMDGSIRNGVPQKSKDLEELFSYSFSSRYYYYCITVLSLGTVFMRKLAV